MEGWITLFLFLGYGWITWQDFKLREVYLISYILIWGLLTTKFIFLKSIDLGVVKVNCAILGIVLSSLVFYYLLRYGLNFLERLKTGIGFGDILLLPVLITSFSPFNFVLFLVVSLLISLIYWTVNQLLISKEPTVPLAGIQTLLLNLIIIMELTGYFNSYIDLVLLY